MFDLVNEEPPPTTAQDRETILYPIGGHWGFFNRLRNLSGSEIIEDIPEYSGYHEMFQILSATDS